MALDNNYNGLTKLKDWWGKVKANFTYLDERISTIITTPAEGVSAQEIIDARKGETALGDKIDAMDAAHASHEAEDATDAHNIANITGLEATISSKANTAQENLIEITPQNGWVHRSPKLTYYKDTIGRVHLWGQLQNGTYTDGTVVGTLPVGYRPSGNVRVPCVKTNDGSIPNINISPAGEIAIYGLSSTGAISIDCSFRVV
jgi:hypothetical protein